MRKKGKIIIYFLLRGYRNWWDYFMTCRELRKSRRTMLTYCGPDIFYNLPVKIQLRRIKGKFGVPYIFCNWKIMVNDPGQIVDVKFNEYVKSQKIKNISLLNFSK